MESPMNQRTAPVRMRNKSAVCCRRMDKSPEECRVIGTGSRAFGWFHPVLDIRHSVLLAALIAGSCPLASSAPAATPEQPVPLSPEANDFVTSLILLSVKDRYVDDDDWGGSKRVQSGLNIRMEHGRLKTSRRWKQIKHGTWKRAEVQLLDPQEHFKLTIILLPSSKDGEPRYHVRANARLRVAGRQQEWANGLKLYSVSADAIADVKFSGNLKINRRFTDKDGSRTLTILPEMETASLELSGMRFTRIGHAKGTIAREFGRSVESIVRRLIRRESNRLASRINERINRKPERFEIPLGFLAFTNSKSPTD